MIKDNLSYEEYAELIKSVGWKLPSKRLLEIGLKNSFNAKYVIDGKTVGMARLTTDGGYIGFITDVVVMPEYQRQKIGTKLINNLIDRAKKTLLKDESMIIQLLAADGKTKFYKQFGFKEKKEIVEAGMYMWIQNDKN